MGKNKTIADKINKRVWWRTVIVDRDAISERGLFLASSFRDAEFYGRPRDKKFRVKIEKPLIGTSEIIEKKLFGEKKFDWEKINISEIMATEKRIKKVAEKLGYDSIAYFLSKKEYQNYQVNGRMPVHIELTVFNHEKTNVEEDDYASPDFIPFYYKEK